MRKTGIISLLILAAAFNAYAAVPNLLTYQGRLKETGLAVNGNRAVEIFLCDAETGGACTTTGAQGTAVTNGLFRSTFTLPSAADITAGSWYLEIHVGGTTLLPRERLTGNAYSLFSTTAAYATAIAPASVTNASIANGTITDAKLDAITTPGKVANSATTATNANTPGAIVLRDGSGNFSANTITANVVGNVTGNATTATSANTATTAVNFTGVIGGSGGDVTGAQSNAVVGSVGGQSAANIAAGAVLANNASSGNLANAIIRRDSSGNFWANTFTGNVTGNVTGNITGGITGNVTGAASLNVLKAGDTMSGNLNMGANNITNTGTLNTAVLNAVNIAMSGNLDLGNWELTRVGTLNVNLGSAAAPSITFVGGTTTGIYAPAANTIGFATAGTQRMNIGAAGAVTINSSLALPAGSAAAPSLSFTGSTNTGISAASANRLGFSTSGSERMSIDAAGGVTIASMTVTGPAVIARQPVVYDSCGSGSINVNSGMFGYTLGVSGECTVYLPPAVVGSWLTIVKMGTASLTIRTVGDLGYIGDSISVSNITASKAAITLQAVLTSQWAILGYHGTWTGL